jgi:ubiquitin carboxyl-terminal hydrolase 48
MVVILSSSALRAVEFLKPLSVFRCKIAKLFAKHMKVQEQVELLSKSYQPIAIGTPGRMKKLLEMNALSFQHTTHLIIDLQIDKKNMTILDLKDTAIEVVEILQYYALEHLNENKMKIVLY